MILRRPDRVCLELGPSSILEAEAGHAPSKTSLLAPLCVTNACLLSAAPSNDVWPPGSFPWPRCWLAHLCARVEVSALFALAPHGLYISHSLTLAVRVMHSSKVIPPVRLRKPTPLHVPLLNTS